MINEPWFRSSTKMLCLLDVAEYVVVASAAENHARSTLAYRKAIRYARERVALNVAHVPTREEIEKAHTTARNWRRTNALCLSWIVDEVLWDVTTTGTGTLDVKRFTTALPSCVPEDVVVSCEARWRWVDAGGNPRAHGNVRRAFEALVAAGAVTNAYAYLSQMRQEE